MHLPTKLKIEQNVIFSKEKRKKSRGKLQPHPDPVLSHLRQGFGGPSGRSGGTGPLDIFLLGDPAAGKATQAAKLLKKYSLYDLDMGKELRKLQARDKKIRTLLSKTYAKGNLTQTNLVRKIFRQRIVDTPPHKGILFDGNPKMIGEARLIQGWLKQHGRRKAVLIYLSVPVAETIKRIAGRKEYFKGKFSKRSDDNINALKNRYKYYRKNVSAVVNFLKTRYPYKKISGLGTPAQVEKRIQEFVKNYL